MCSPFHGHTVVVVMIIICRPFWPLSYGSEMMWDAGYSQFNVSLLGMDDFTPRTIRLRLEVRNSSSFFGR